MVRKKKEVSRRESLLSELASECVSVCGLKAATKLRVKSGQFELIFSS